MDQRPKENNRRPTGETNHEQEHRSVNVESKPVEFREYHKKHH